MTDDVARRVLGTGAPSPAAAWPVQAAALAMHELRLAARRGESLLVQFVIPVGALVVLTAIAPAGPDAVDRALPASITLAVMAAALVSLAIATGYERAYGVLKRLGGSPAGTSVLVASKTVAVVLIEVAQLTVLVAVAAGQLGWRPGPDVDPALLLAGIVLGTMAFAGLGLLLAGTLRAEATLALSNLLFVLALALGGIAVPLDRLPASLAAVAAVLPPAALTHVLAVALGAPGDATTDLALLAGWAVVLVALAVWRFRWD